MPLRLTPVQIRLVLTETVVSTVLNAVVPAGIIFAVDLPPPRHLIGGDDIVGALLKTAGIATFAMTIMLTWVIRLRMRKGGLPHCAWPRDDRGPYRIVPANLLMRAVVLAALAIVVLVPTGTAVAALLGLADLTRTGFVAFNIVSGTAVGLALTHLVVLPALADR